MLPYYVFFTVLIFCCFTEVYTEGRVNKLLYPFVFFIYLFFFGFRGFVGWDVINYYANYQYNEHDTFEVGYSILVDLFRYFDFSYFSLVFFITLLQSIGFFFFFRKYSPYPIVSLLICISMNAMHLQIETLRHTFLLVIFLNSLEFLKNRNFLYYSISMLFAFCFHKFALVLYLLYFLYPLLNRKKFNFLINLLLYLGFVLFILGLSPIHILLDTLSILVPSLEKSYILGKLFEYANNEFYSGNYSNFIIKVAFFFIIWTPILISRNKILGFLKGDLFFIKMFKVSLIIFFYTYHLKVVWLRVYVLTFSFPVWILLAIAIKVNRNVLKTVYLLSICSILMLRIIHTVNSYPYLYYKNILFQNDSYIERKYIVNEFDKQVGNVY